MTPSQDPGSISDARASAAEERVSDPNLADLDLNSVVDRLQTFVNWPLSFLTKEDLAAAGFYFIGKDDIVKCAYCKVEIGRWDPEDDPETEHRKYSTPSKCLFLLWSKTSTPENSRIDERVDDTCGPFGIEGVKQAVLKHDKIARAALGDSYHNSTYISVDESNLYYSERLKTFDTWPSDSKVSKEALCEAGFVYRRMYPKCLTRNFSIKTWFTRQRKNETKKDDTPVEADHTSCFHCGGNLRRWMENDDPWEEHAGWFPECKFVLVMKGQKFIDAARAKLLAINRSTEEISGRMIPNQPST